MRQENKTRLLLLCISLLVINIGNAQDQFTQAFNKLKRNVIDIEIDKTQFKQTIDVLDVNRGKIKYTYNEIDEKGKSVKGAYEFFVTDIDKNTIQRKPSGKKLFVVLKINNKQKFIKQYKDDKVDDYLNEIELLVNNADAGQLFIDDFKSLIGVVQTNTITWKSSKEIMEWLSKTIGKVTTSTGIYAQKFSYSEQKNYLLNLNVVKTDLKGATTEELYEFNVLDVDRYQSQLKVDGSQIIIRLTTKGREPFIRYVKKGEQQNFEKEIDVVAEDVAQARDILLAFNETSNFSKKQVVEYSDLSKAINFLKTNIQEIKIDNKLINQNFTATLEDGTKSVLTVTNVDSKGKPTAENYVMYLYNLEPNAIGIDVSGKKVIVNCKVKNKEKLIKYSKENLVQGFENEVDIVSTDLENARLIVDALKAAIQLSDIKNVYWKNMDEALSFLSRNVKGEVVDKTTYNLSFTANNKEPYQLKYIKTKIDEKGGSAENILQVYPYSLEGNTVKVRPSGKYLSVYINTKNKKDFVKQITNNKDVSFSDELELIAFDAKVAKDIEQALKYISISSKPKEVVFGSKQQMMDFIVDNVKPFKLESTEIVQKIEFANANPNSTIYTKNTRDDKGKQAAEVYEFSMSDVNKMMVNYDVRSKNIQVKISCKNGAKLIKVYKDGQQKSFDSEVYLLADDLNTARVIADAIISLINTLEK